MLSPPAGSFEDASCRAEKSVFSLPASPEFENGDSVRQYYLATTELSDGLAPALQSFLQGLGRKDEGGRPVLPW